MSTTALHGVWRLDPTWRRVGGGKVLIAGSPLRLFRVSDAGSRILDALENGTPVDRRAAKPLLDRLIDAGALHPTPHIARRSFDDVTFVVPVRGSIGSLPHHHTVVVDDASSPAVTLPGGPNSHTAHLIRLDENIGPAGARNAGTNAVTSEFVVFVDADIELPDEGRDLSWLDTLMAHFDDPKVAVVAPRIMSTPGTTWLARYEASSGPLDMGPIPARVAAGTRVSYVPSAVLVARVSALRAIGGFDAALRTGEDVDLVWRLVESGHRVRYEPAITLHHTPRSSVRAAIRQRIGYGESAAPLARRHPGALAPARMSAWSLAVVALLLLRRPTLALALAGATSVALMRKLQGVPAVESLRVATLGHLGAGLQLARAARRVWWPLLALAVCVRRARPLVVAALVAPTLADAARRRSVAELVLAPGAVVDDLAYGIGVWRGVLRERCLDPLVPTISGWPQRGDG